VVPDALSRLDTEVSSATASSKLHLHQVASAGIYLRVSGHNVLERIDLLLQIAELYENTDDKSIQDVDYPLSTHIIA
jgi:hypothetical protein